MGSGKTSVGRLVADALGCPFLDLDEIIVKKAGHSIPVIFEAEGEKGFRRKEKQALEQTVGKYAESTAVLALGGGTVTVPGAIGLLQEKTLCIPIPFEPIWKGRRRGALSRAKAGKSAWPSGCPCMKRPRT